MYPIPKPKPDISFTHGTYCHICWNKTHGVFIGLQHTRLPLPSILGFDTSILNKPTFPAIILTITYTSSKITNHLITAMASDLEQLVEFGFDEAKAKLALKKAGGRT